MKLCFRVLLLPVLLLLCMNGHAQTGSAIGKVFDQLAKPIEGVEITVSGTDLKTFTQADGTFALRLPVGQHTLIFKHISYGETRAVITIRPAGVETVEMKMLEAGTTLDDQVIRGDKDPNNTRDPNDGTEVVPILPEMPSVINSIESRLQTTAAGVVANNEFSSQYRVRGGNFDENLVYVNDIEIYRPFLIRSGQQEGLSFVNPALTEEVGFSSGGFQAKYGDRLSSVLDVKYKEPTIFKGSVDMGIINPSAHFEGRIWLNKKVIEAVPDESERKFNPAKATFLVGVRRFTPAYVLGSLDTKGNYKPTFHDVQGMFTFTPKQNLETMRVRTRKNGMQDTIYRPRERVKLTLFGNYADNKYLFIPQTRETSFGTIQSVIRLRVGFEGREITSYQTLTGAAVLEYRPTIRFRVKHIFSIFSTLESELFEVEGGYYLSDVNTNFGSEGYNEVVFDRGIGTFYRSARNYLYATVAAIEQRGDWFPDKQMKHRITWGLRAQQQYVNDQLKEWNGTDSAGYFQLEESYRGSLEFTAHIYKAFLQDHWKLNKKETMRLIYGARVIYNDLNGQLMVAPRVQFVIDPTRGTSGNDLMETSDVMRTNNRKYQLRFAAGTYHQPAFYREMRALDGSANLDRKAQVSYHFIAGGDYLFRVWGRDFRLFAEAYFKYLDNIAPYEVENVRIRYYPYNYAVGYAYGLDARVSGEFIRGVDSWFTLGVLRTVEDVIETPEGFVARPSDQRLNFGMYFQDELPINPNYKVHINFVYGSGLKFGPPRVLEARSVFDYPSYQRVDLGFSRLWVFGSYKENIAKGKKSRGLESLWVSFEVFNLFQRSNVVSYTWIKDVFNTQFAVPNYLSARLLNLRATLKF